jgi:mannosyltransferase
VTRQRISPALWLIPLLLFAAWLRVTALDARALWFDEGVSLTFARMPLRDLVTYHNLWQEVNPPVYRLSLGGWTHLVGATALTARLLSAWLGVLGIALTYRIGREWGLDRRAALAGAAFLAVLPMQVYYSREAKGYTFIQWWLLIAVWIWLRLFPRSPQGAASESPGLELAGLSLILFLSTGLAFGSHYLSALLMVVTGVWTLVWIATARRRGAAWRAIAPRAGVWFGAQLAAGLVWIPWVLATGRGAAAGTQAAAGNIGQIARDPLTYFREMLAELGGGPLQPTPGLWISLGLVALASVALARPALKRAGKWALGSWLAGPLLLGLAVQVAIPFFYPRFLMYVTPALALLAGAAASLIPRPNLIPGSSQVRRGAFDREAFRGGGASIERLGRWATAGVLLALIGAMARLAVGIPSLAGPETDLRPLATDLAAREQPGDALIYSYHWQPGMLAAYLPPDRQPTTYPSFFEPGALDSSMQAILDRHGRVWLLTYQIGADNPINDVGLWLLAHAATPGSTWYDESQLSLFLGPGEVNNPGPASACSTLGSGRIELCFAPLEAEIEAAAPRSLTLALTWTSRDALAERYVVFVHLLGPDSPVPVAQQDTQPANGQRPTYSWTLGEPVLDLHSINIPPAVGAGTTLTVVAGLYDADTLERVPVDGGGDSVQIGQVIVAGR